MLRPSGGHAVGGGADRLAAEAGYPAMAYTEPLGDDEALAWLISSPDGQMSAKTQSEQRGRRARQTAPPWARPLTWKE